MVLFLIYAAIGSTSRWVSGISTYRRWQHNGSKMATMEWVGNEGNGHMPVMTSQEHGYIGKLPRKGTVSVVSKRGGGRSHEGAVKCNDVLIMACLEHANFVEDVIKLLAWPGANQGA